MIYHEFHDPKVLFIWTNIVCMQKKCKYLVKIDHFVDATMATPNTISDEPVLSLVSSLFTQTNYM